jgi:predicted lipid-binding transport protein (Tim44 family)
MKRPFALLVTVVVAVFALAQVGDVDAARMGGGRSFGAQRSITPAPSHAPSATAPGAASNPVMPAPSGVTPARPVAPAAAPATGGAGRWLGPIAGIAAGLGLAALFSHLGLSESFGSVLLLVVLVGVGVFVLRALFARRMATAPSGYAGRAAAPTSPRFEPVMARNDTPAASEATPRFEPAWNGGTSATASGVRRFPAGFEPAPFVAEAKRQFYRLQDAYDRGDKSMLADVLTPRMQDEIGRDIATRGAHVPTEVLSLEGEVLDVATEGNEHWASVRFKGLTREDGRDTAEPFDEVWNLVKPVDGSGGWRLAGIQQSATA